MTSRTDADIRAIVEAAVRDALEQTDEATGPDDIVTAATGAARCECCGRRINAGADVAVFADRTRDVVGAAIAHAGPCVADDRIIAIRLKAGTTTVRARVIGMWAMHPSSSFDSSRWTVTHVPSGRDIPHVTLDRAEAWSLVKAIGEQCSTGDYCTPAPSRDSMARVRSIVESTLGRPLRAEARTA